MFSKNHAPNEKSYEKVAFFLRRHWIIVVYQLILLIVLVAIPLILYWLFSNILPSLLESDLGKIFTILLASIYYLSAWLIVFHNLVNYYLDTWIVTNDRIISIEQKGLFYRTISELDLYRIQDVASEVKGILPTILHYGDIYIQTAGTAPHFIFRQVADPNIIAKKILELAEEDRKYHLMDIKQENT